MKETVSAIKNGGDFVYDVLKEKRNWGSFIKLGTTQHSNGGW